MKQIISQLVKFKTTTSNCQENLRAINWVKTQLKGLPLNFKSFKFEGHPALVITTQKTKTPKLFLLT